MFQLLQCLKIMDIKFQEVWGFYDIERAFLFPLIKFNEKKTAHGFWSTIIFLVTFTKQINSFFTVYY